MKQSTLMRNTKIFFTTFLLLAIQVAVFAQDKAIDVNINEQQVGSWFERNWKWVVGGIVLLLLIVLFSGSSSRRKTTTVVRRDDYGNTKSVTTTEVVD